MKTMKMKTMGVDPATAFPQVESMLYKLAWKTAKTYPVTFEEARSVCYNAFMRSCADYQSWRGAKFSSWCYYWAWTELKTMLMKRSSDRHVFYGELIGDLEAVASPTCGPAMESIEGLSKEAKCLVKTILNPPRSVAMQSRSPRQLLSSVKKYLVQQGMNLQKIKAAEQEARAVFASAWATA